MSIVRSSISSAINNHIVELPIVESVIKEESIVGTVSVDKVRSE